MNKKPVGSGCDDSQLLTYILLCVWNVFLYVLCFCFPLVPTASRSLCTRFMGIDGPFTVQPIVMLLQHLVPPLLVAMILNSLNGSFVPRKIYQKVAVFFSASSSFVTQQERLEHKST